MFNKSGVFGRNEPVNSTNRRDSAPMTSSGTASPPPAERLPGRPAPTVKEALPAAPVVDAAQPAVPVARMSGMVYAGLVLNFIAA